MFSRVGEMGNSIMDYEDTPTALHQKALKALQAMKELEKSHKLYTRVISQKLIVSCSKEEKINEYIK